MSKRRNKDPGGVRQLHPTRSFDQYVADATLAKFGGYIDAQIQQAAQAILIRQQQSMQNLLTRLVALEELAGEKLSVTKDELANRVADIQDRFEGFEAAETVETGDRVRLEIKTKTAEQTEYQGSSRLLVDNAGTGRTLGKELEGALIGMKAGETRQVLFGKDNSMEASIYVNKISRQPKQEQETQAADAPATEVKETADASPNAG